MCDHQVLGSKDTKKILKKVLCKRSFVAARKYTAVIYQETEALCEPFTKE